MHRVTSNVRYSRSHPQKRQQGYGAASPHSISLRVKIVRPRFPLTFCTVSARQVARSSRSIPCPRQGATLRAPLLRGSSSQRQASAKKAKAPSKIADAIAPEVSSPPTASSNATCIWQPRVAEIFTPSQSPQASAGKQSAPDTSYLASLYWTGFTAAFYFLYDPLSMR